MKNSSPWRHEHMFNPGTHAAERRTRLVMWITLATMIAEVAAGWRFGSMALLADGWHMSSHALAIGLSAFAYAAARRYAKDPRFAFGTWKIEILAGFASAIFLLGIAATMAIGSVERLLFPVAIQYGEAIVVGVIGLVVNIVCASILGHSHDGDDNHHHHHDHRHQEKSSSDGGHRHSHHHDLNLKSAYIHVITDALTSVLAIIALAGGWFYGWAWLDPIMGIVGAVLVAIWSKNLIVETAKVLLDREMDHPIVAKIRTVVDEKSNRITDLHVWRVGKASYSCVLCIVTSNAALTPERVRQRLAECTEVVHSTIEIHHTDTIPT